jgi:hypothetical protein
MRTNDGTEIKATTPDDVVTELRLSSRLTPARSNREFMREAAGRALAQTGKRVRHDSAENFIGDLLLAGLLTDDGHQDHDKGE